MEGSEGWAIDVPASSCARPGGGGREIPQNELSWLHSLDWRQRDAGLEGEGVQRSWERTRLGGERTPRAVNRSEMSGFVCAPCFFPSATCQRHMETSPSFAVSEQLHEDGVLQGQL